MDDKYINISEAAEMLGVTKLTLRNWDRNNKLNALRHPINNYRVYRVADICNLLNKIKYTEKSLKFKKKEKNQFYDIKVIHRKD